MPIPGFVVSILLIGTMAMGAGVSSGQTFPNKPLRIVTAPVGGGGDRAARIIAQGISGSLGQSVLVDNRPATTIGAFVLSAPPDGYTLALLGNSFWITPLFESTAYDPVADFLPITLVERSPIILVVHPALPVKSVKELIALAKARPGELNYAGGAAGAASSLAGELFNSIAGVKITSVNFSGGGPAMTSLLSGEVQLRFASIGEAGQLIKSGRLRALAVTSARPSALAPGVPSVGETLPGYESVVMQAIFAPVKTPDAILNRLNQEIVRVLNRVEVKDYFLSGGSEAAPSSREEAIAAIKADIGTGKLLKGRGTAR